jgi:pyrroline-5-carboxylate reductase
MIEKKYLNEFSPTHHAILFSFIAKEVISSCGQVGINALKQAVRRYGKERGQRMAQRVIFHGDELSMEKFLAYGEWIPASEMMVVKTTPNLITHVKRCPWVDAWKQENILEFGRIYCTEIDEALVDGFNPDLTLKIHSTLSFGANNCEFEYYNIALSPTVQKSIDEKKAQLGKSRIKSWEYHTAHLYYTLLNELQKECGEDGKTAVIHALTRFGKKYGQNFRNTLISYNNIDFTTIHYPTTKITIIGFGNLMQSLFLGIREFVGQENVSTHINATTADQNINTRKKIEKEFGIKLYFQNNLLALQNLQPEIILFAPPPNIAPYLIKSDLKDYIQHLRKQNLPLPDIVAFPPIPPGSYYQEILGEDIRICTVLPNDIREIGGVSLYHEGHHFCTFSSSWPNKNYERIYQFFIRFGEMIDIPPKEVLPLLITRVVVTSLAYFAISLQKLEIPVISIVKKKSIQSITEIWENQFRLISRNDSEENKSKRSASKIVLEEIFSSFYEGMFEYMKSQSLDKAKYKAIVNDMIVLIFRLMKNSHERELNQNIITAATKGGLLELCMRFYDVKIFPRLTKVRRVEDLNQIFYNELLVEFTQMCNAILTHGKKLLK